MQLGGLLLLSVGDDIIKAKVLQGKKRLEDKSTLLNFQHILYCFFKCFFW